MDADRIEMISAASAMIAGHEAPLPNRGASLEVIVAEFQHCVRNVLSVVQCLVTNTSANTTNDYRVAVKTRVAVLSDACRFIENALDCRVPLASLLERTLRPCAVLPSDRVVLAGPDIVLEPHCALSLHLVFHELATNACKHGALKFSTGSVEVLWDILVEPDGRALAIQWRERGGPIVRKPQYKGFGMRMIAKTLAEALVELEFAPTGVVFRVLLEPGSWAVQPEQLT